MGIGKSIKAYTTSQLYSPNTAVFIAQLAELLDADFIISEYDTEKKIIGEINRKTTFNKSNQYRLTLEHTEYEIIDKKVTFPEYELIFPINHPNEKHLQIYFNANNSVQFCFLTFEHLWSGFIGQLKFGLEPHLRSIRIESYQQLRKEYMYILKKLKIYSLFIVTDGGYNIENIEDKTSYSTLEFNEIKEIALKEDNLKSFDLASILDAEQKEELDLNFIQVPSLRIALIDYFRAE